MLQLLLITRIEGRSLLAPLLVMMMMIVVAVISTAWCTDFLFLIESAFAHCTSVAQISFVLIKLWIASSLDV